MMIDLHIKFHSQSFHSPASFGSTSAFSTTTGDLEEGKMAHAALVYLRQLLDEEMIQFSCRVLEIEEEKARAFCLKATKVLYRLKKFRVLNDVPCSYVMALKKGSEPLALTVTEDLIQAARSPEVQLDSRGIMPKIQHILRSELYLLCSSLKSFLRQLGAKVVRHSAPSLILQQELTNDLISAHDEFRMVIGFFHRLVGDAKFLEELVATLLQKLEGCDQEAADRVKAAADEAGNCIEEFLTVRGNLLFEKKDYVEDMDMQSLLDHVNRLLNNVLDPDCDLKTESSDSFSEPESSRSSQAQRPRGCFHKCLEILANLCSTDEKEYHLSSIQVERYENLRRHLKSKKSAPCEEWEDFEEDLGEEMSNVIDELTRPALGLAMLKIYETGEATLAQEVFSLRGVVHHFGCRALVNGASNACQVLYDALRSVAPFSGEIHGGSIEDIGDLLCESLKGKRYLVILTNLLNFQIWDVIHTYFPDDKLGSRILLSSVTPESSGKTSNEDIVVGINEDISKIIDELTRAPLTLSSVTICSGMSGIGKTTVAKKVFHHPSVIHHFHCLVWVSTISSIDQVLSHLLHGISVREDIRGLSIEDKGELLYRSLKGRKYLVVADGLWNFDLWNAVQRYLPDDDLGSRVLITTRVMESLTSPCHCIASLDKDRGWELLEKMVFREESCPIELVAVGKVIAEICDGLPLAIVVIAGVLRNIPRSFISWQIIMHDLSSVVSSESEPCLDILALSYNYLPHQLKTCLLYMGAFPENCEVGVKYLCNLWIANGFLDSRSSRNSETEAEKHLKDLIGRNLISIGRRGLDGKVKTCFIAARVRSLCLREARKENFMHVLEAGDYVEEVVENIRHLILNLDQLEDFQLLPPLLHLRSLIWLNHGSDFAPGKILLEFSVFKWLRVLDIYFVPFDTFPLQLLNLVNLRYLALNVSYELDARISQFSKLQTLVVYGPWIVGKGNASPGICLEFWKMPWLRNIYVKVPTRLRYPYLLGPLLNVSPAGCNLQSLSMVTFSSCTKELFLLMPNLKKLGVSETKEDFENDELTKCFHSLSFLSELQTLKCIFYKGSGESRNLGLDILPLTLKKLTLSGSGLSWDEMKFLALLPKLETLKLKNYAFQGPEWMVTEEVFGCLKQLLIDHTDLVNWEVLSSDHFPCLERLVLRSCEFLEMIPSGVGELSALRLVELHHCSESSKRSAKKFEERYGCLKVVCRGY